MTDDETTKGKPPPLRRILSLCHSSFSIHHSPIPTAAHPADNSQARFKIEPRRVETRLTLNLYTSSSLLS